MSSNNQFFDPLTKDLPANSKPLMVIVFAASAVSIGVAFYNYLVGQPVIPLFYTLAQPREHLVPKLWLFLIPSISLFISISHWWIVRVLTQMSQTLARVFLLFSLAIQLFLLVSLLRVTYITL